MTTSPGEERIYVMGEKEHENDKRIRQQGILVNPNLRRELQTMRDELNISGYDGWRRALVICQIHRYLL